MLKLDLKLIFWSLAVHRYPKQPPRVIIFAAMGPGMKLVIDGNLLAKKDENLKRFCKTHVIHIKKYLVNEALFGTYGQLRTKILISDQVLPSGWGISHVL